MDQNSRNRRGCLITALVPLIVLGFFLAFYFLAPTSERNRSRSTGEAPVSKVDPHT